MVLGMESPGIKREPSAVGTYFIVYSYFISYRPISIIYLDIRADRLSYKYFDLAIVSSDKS